MHRFRPVIPSLLAAVLAASCQGTGNPARPPATGGTKTTAPTAKPTGTGGPATPAPAAGPAALLRTPKAGTASLKGEVVIDAAYAAKAAGGKVTTIGGTTLVGVDGASIVAAGAGNLVGAGAGNLVGTDGASIKDGLVATTGGQIVAAGAGNVVAPVRLVGTDGATLVGTDGGSLIGTDGASLIGTDGASLVGTDGASIVGAGAGNLVGAGAGNLVGAGAGNYRLAQAYGEALPVVGALVSVVDMRTGFTVPLGEDADGKPVYAVFSDAAGKFEVHVPAEAAPYARVVARAAGRRDPRMTLTAIARLQGADATRLDEDAAGTTGYIREVMAGRFVDMMGRTREQVATVFAGNVLSLIADADGGGARDRLYEVWAALDAIGAGRMRADHQRVLGLAMADRMLADLGAEALRAIPFAPIPFDETEPLAATTAARFNTSSALAEIGAAMAGIRKGYADQADRQADPAAWFARLPFVIDANVQAPVGRPWTILKAGDVLDLVSRVHLAPNDDAAYDRAGDVIDGALAGAPTADPEAGRADRDRLRFGGTRIFATLLLQLLGVEALTDVIKTYPEKRTWEGVVALVRTTGKQLADASRAAPPLPVAADVRPTPPPAPAATVETVAEGLAGPQGLAVDPAADPPVVYVVESGNAGALRRLTFDAAGRATPTTLIAPGALAEPLNEVADLIYDGAASPPCLYAVEFTKSRIRKIALGEGAPVVTTIAGGGIGYAEGPGASARFNQPTGLALSPDRRWLIVADAQNHRLRKIDMQAATFDVSPYAGDGKRGRVEGKLAQVRVAAPRDVAFGADGALYFVQTGNEALRRITDPFGAGAASAMIAGGDSRVTLDGFWAGAHFDNPTSLAVDPAGRLAVVDHATSRVRLATPEGWVSTLAGDPAGTKDPPATAFADGPGAQARFGILECVGVAKNGDVFVSDRGTGRVRRIRY